MSAFLGGQGLTPRLVRKSLVLFVATLLAPVIARSNDTDGAWSPVHSWPLITVHAALTPDGRVLSYGTNGDGKQTGYFIYDIWDPSAGLTGGHMTINNMTLTDIFCSSQVIIPMTGEIFIAGGDNWTGSGTTNTGNNNSNLFDFRDNALARSANMNRARWYSSSTVLINGDVYVQGGSGGADFPEVRTANGSFRLLTGAPTSGFAANFPRNFLAPDGRVFGYDTNGKMCFVNTAGTGSISSAGQFPSMHAGWTSSAAMFAPGKILQLGGNSNLPVVIDINGPVPTVTPTGAMSSRRQWVSATILPDGRVLATGGSEVDNQLTNVNNSAEIWEPATGMWHVGASGARARLYHSAALLLPDATVLVSGGGAPGPLNNTNAEIYYPPYLFSSAGGFADRPEILSAPSSANVGDTLTIEVDSSDISRVTLVKTGSVTHSVNMDARFIELPFTAAGNVLYANLPTRAGLLPPGFYLLFAIDSAGVPSRAKMLNANVDPTPDVSVDYTPTIGGNGGSAFQLACAVDETLVGVHGNFSTYVNRIGPKCVTVDHFGRWIGDPHNGPLIGTTTTGTQFNKTCPRDYAVSVFRGRSGQYVNQIEIGCRALTPSGGLTGVTTWLGASGGTGGTAQAASSCGTGNPVYALYGRAGGWIDSFGLQCRAAAITPISTNSTPVIVNPGPQDSFVGQFVDLTIAASDSDADPLTFTASGLPVGLSISSSTGRITGSLSTAGIYNTAISVTDGSDFDVAAFEWKVVEAPPLVVEPMTAERALVDEQVSYTASATGGVNVRYKWNFGDGTAETAYSSSPAVTHSFSSPGVFFVTLTVSHELGGPAIQSFVQTVHLPPTENAPAHSTNLVYESRVIGASRVWVVNQDNDSVSVLDAASHTRLSEIAVGSGPRAVAIARDGRIWVVNKLSASITIIDPSSLVPVQTVALPFGSQPFGLAFSPVANEGFVALEASGMVLKLDGSSGAQLGSIDVGAHPRHLSIDGAGTTVYVSRFITPPQAGEATAAVGTEIGGVATGGEILRVDPASMSVLGKIVLRHSDKPDFETQGRGVPNYVGPMVISPDGMTAMAPSKQDNIGRGTLRSGQNLNFQNTVRAIGSVIDPVQNVEDYASRLDFDNASLASAVVYEPFGNYLFVALETSREIAVVDAYALQERFRFSVGLAPQGLAISEDGQTLFVNNFMDRRVGVYDLSELLTAGQWNVAEVANVSSVASEALDAQVLRGKQLFYDAADTRLARDGYLSCATCHNDGGHDGRTWDLTGMGEGLRNTISLTGTAASHGFSHWSQNFDEIQDFEGQIRALAGGTGLMADVDFNQGTRSQPLGDPKAGISGDLDALAAYVASLDRVPNSPHRNSDGTLTAIAVAGRSVFRRESCGSCHGGVDFTDSGTGGLHDIGTLKPESGSRLGGPLLGIDTPTLRGVWNTPPYLHDGSAGTLSAAIAAHQGVTLSPSEMDSLVAYINQIDAREASAPEPNRDPSIVSSPVTTATDGIDYVYDVDAVDPDETDVLSYSLSAAPTGMSINSVTGLISWTPASVHVGSQTVTVRVADEIGGSSMQTFPIDVAPANLPPSITSAPNGSANEGEPYSYDVEASDPDEGDALSFALDARPAGMTIDASSGLIQWTPTSGQVGTHNVVARVVDNHGAFATQSFEVVVQGANRPPSITSPGDQSGIVGAQVSVSVSAHDPDGDPLTFSATGLPPGINIDENSGLIAGVPTTGGTFGVTVTVHDGKTQASAGFVWTIDSAAPPQVGPVSDEFEGPLNNGVWTFVNPLGDGQYSLNSGRLSISVPAGTGHDLWTTGNDAPRLMQTVADQDFDVEVKVDSTVTRRYQMQGLLVEEDANTFIRAELFSTGSGSRIYCAVIDDGSVSTKVNLALGNVTGPVYLRLARSDGTWTYRYSLDGTSWQTATTFAAAMTMTAIGVHSGNFQGSSSPAHTAVYDYFRNLAATEPPPPPSYALTPSSTGQGSVLLNPSGGTYTDGTVVQLTAIPDTGWLFAGWAGAVTGSSNPVSVTVHGNASVQAQFVQMPTEHDVTVTTTGQGSVTLDPPGGTYVDGTPVEVIAAPNAGWRFSGWSGSVAGTVNPLSIVVEADLTIGAAFIPDPLVGGILTDEFTSEPSLSVWTFVNPLGDGQYSVDGGRLSISVPAATGHDLWTTGNDAPRLMQAVADQDFDVEVKVDSTVTRRYQMQGLVVEEDADTFIRAELFSTGSGSRIYCAVIDDGSVSTKVNLALGNVTGPVYLRLARSGGTWTYRYSLDGTSWQTATTFTAAMTMTAIGVHSGNHEGTSSPAHTAVYDYFRVLQ